MSKWERSSFEERSEESKDEIRDRITERLLPLEGGFQEFCKKVGLDNICDPPAYGIYGRDWGHYYLEDLDRTIVRRSLDGLDFYLCCTQYPRYADTLGEMGIPTFSTDIGQVILETVRFNNRTGKVEVRPTSFKGELVEWMELGRFEAMNPKLVGVSKYTDRRKSFSFYELELVLPTQPRPTKEPKLTLKQRVLKWLFGYY